MTDRQTTEPDAATDPQGRLEALVSGDWVFKTRGGGKAHLLQLGYDGWQIYCRQESRELDIRCNRIPLYIDITLYVTSSDSTVERCKICAKAAERIRR